MASAATAAATTLKVQVENWKKTTKVDTKSFVLIDADEKSHTILFTLDAKLVKASLPKTAESAWMIESDEKDLLEFITTISSWAIDKGASLSVDAFLDKCLTVLSNKKAKKEKKAAAADHDAWGDEDADAHGEDGGDGGWGGEDGGGDGDDWEDGSHSHAKVTTTENEFEKWHAIKKRWAAKEAEMRAKMKASGLVMIDESKLKSQIFSSQAASKMLSNTLETLMKTGAKSGIDAAPIDDSIFHWRLRLSDFPTDSVLYKDLKKLKADYNTDYVELNITFPCDLYPFYPPSVRLVRPRLKNFLMGRIVCSDDLQLSKWSPVREITDVLASIRRLLTTYGAVENEPANVNDPANALPPYTALEFQLLRLSMLTEISPRVLKTMTDAERKDFIVPKSKPKVAASAAAAAPTRVESDDYYDSYGGGAAGGKVKKTHWASGTGYGHSGQSDWDPIAWAAAQAKKDSEIMEIVREMLHEFEAKTVPPGLIDVLEQSCLVPFLESYLKNDSLTEMERHADIYKMVFAVCQNIAKHPSLSRLFLLLPLEKKALSAYVKELGAQAAIVEKFNAQTKGSGGGSSSAALTMTQRIMAMAQAVEKATKFAEEEEKKRSDSKSAAGGSSGAAAAAAAPTGSASSKDKKTAEKSDAKAAAFAERQKLENEYVTALVPQRFDMEVEKFAAQHYWKEHAHEANGSPAWVRHLATEYSDLSKSLPINYDSSVFMRVHESKMAFAQMIIIAPPDTPYEGGAFLFDMWFPPQYPAVAPKVNLQTTGGGSHRFNPNLYHCGKVCLSLLGTWSGQKGESWNEKTSTFLQVAVSIQSLIFVPQPYFNEPGYERDIGTARGTQASDAYNADQQQATVKFAMVEMLKNPPPNFEDVVRGHFYLKQKQILATVEKWAVTNDRVRSQLATLRGELAKLKPPTPKAA